MSWDGTLIEDLGPRRDGPTNNTNSNSTKTATVTTAPITSTPVYTQPVSQPVSQPVNNTPKVEEQKVVKQAEPVYTPAPQTAALKILVSLYSYDATEAGELTFVEGETITLLEESESGWWRGRLSNGAEGLFPSNFVEEQGKVSAAPSGDNYISADYKALYDYDAEDPSELTIKENDLLFVETEKDGWYFGYRKSEPAKKGNFPSNFVEKC